jgi:hypothetical protein
MTVAAVTSIDALDLRHETQLVKAALLYADEVTLASPKALMLASLAAFGAAAVAPASTALPSSSGSSNRATRPRSSTGSYDSADAACLRKSARCL